MYKKSKYRVKGLPMLAARALELPYAGEHRLSMIVVLPDEPFGLSALEGKLATFDMAGLDMSDTTALDTEVYLPKFRLETAHNLKTAFQQLGLENLFDQHRVNLTGMAEKVIFVSDFVQKAFIEVGQVIHLF